MIYINENFKTMNELNNTYKSPFSNHKWNDNGINNVLKNSAGLTEEILRNNDNDNDDNIEYDLDDSDDSDNSDSKKRKRSISTETLFGHLIMEDFNNLNINKRKLNNDYDNYKLLLEIKEKINHIEKNIESKNLEKEITAKISKINKTSIDELTKINIKFDQLLNKFDKILVEKDYVIEHLRDEINNLKDELKYTHYNNNDSNNNDHYC